MKHTFYYILFFLTGFCFIACEKDSYQSFIGGDVEGQEIELDTDQNKKGVALSYRNPTWSTRIGRLQGHWHYSWGFEIQPTRPAGVEYTPMFWGKNAPGDENLAYMDSLVEAGAIEYLMGFNEPDGADQANMSVAEAIELWPKLESLGVPLVSPATVNPTNNWMKNFMAQAEERGYRVDYVAMHWYGGPNVMGFLNRVRDTYELYGRPIWITEFAVADWSANSVEDNRHSPEDILAFMEEVLPALDQITYVERYSWFNAQPDNAALSNAKLFDENDQLTALGEFYANHTPNMDAGPGDDSWYNDGSGDAPDPGTAIYSTEAEFTDISLAGVGVSAGGCGNKSGEGLIFMRGVQDGDGDRQLSMTFDVEQAGTYRLDITYFANSTTQLEVIVNGGETIVEDGFGTPGFCFAGPSMVQSIEIELQEGDNEIILSPVQGIQSPYLDRFDVIVPE